MSNHYSVQADGEVKLKIGLAGPESAPAVTVHEVLRKAADTFGKKHALCVKRNGAWVKWTYREYYDDSILAAKAFLKLGLEPFHTVAIIGFNSPEWFIANNGAIFAGGFAAGVYTTNKPDACAFVADHARAQFVVVEDDAQLKKILSVRSKLPHLKHIVQYHGDVSDAGKAAGVLAWDQFLIAGANVPDYEINWRLAPQKPGHCCTLIYTSGTTGDPKAVMISHDNVTWTATTVARELRVTHTDHLISYLPLSHIAAQMVDIHAPMSVGATVWFAQADALKGSLIHTLREVRPTIFLGVPRVWEKFEETMRVVGAQTAGLKKKIATWAKAKGSAGGHAKMEGRGTPCGYGLANTLVFKKIRKSLGFDRCKFMATAAAPIAKETLEYFLSLGMPIYEVYGMSECTGPQTISIPSAHRIGSTGTSIPGVELRIAPGTGEVCFRGRHIFMGYLFNEAKTKESIDADGWLLSGDIGEVDSRGFLTITGRIKELLITAGGENVAPVPIENAIKQALPVLANAMVVGDRRKFLSVLLCLKTTVDETAHPTDTLTADILPQLEAIGCTAKTVSEAIKCEKLLAYLNKGVAAANEQAVSNASKVQKLIVLPRDFSIPGGELGPTLKLRRPIVDVMYKAEVDKLYE